MESRLTHVFCEFWNYLIVMVLLVTSVATEPVRFSLLRDIGGIKVLIWMCFIVRRVNYTCHFVTVLSQYGLSFV